MDGYADLPDLFCEGYRNVFVTKCILLTTSVNETETDLGDNHGYKGNAFVQKYIILQVCN